MDRPSGKAGAARRGARFSAVGCLGLLSVLGVLPQAGAQHNSPIGSWQLQSVPSPTGAMYAQPRGIACTTVSSCVAVGTFEDASSGPLTALVEVSNGASWSIVSTPSPAGATQEVLDGVSCAASMCLAVGSYAAGNVGIPLAELSTGGGSWSLVPGLQPSGSAGSGFNSVSCAAANWCMAVGDDYTGTANIPLAEIWNGESWSLTKPAQAKGWIEGVSCPVVGWCEAAGDSQTKAGEAKSFEQWADGAWAYQSSAVSMQAEGISCASTSMCMAVGAARAKGVAAVFDGTTWVKTRNIPRPEGASEGYGFDGVDCLSTIECAAVGGSYSPTATSVMTGTWNGSKWSLLAAPEPSGTQAFLSTIWCSSAARCAAAGSATGTNQALFPFVDASTG